MKLQAVELTKSFGEKAVLRGVSFCAEGGKALGLLGRNGAGKTTTIRIIMNVFSADNGQVLLDGIPFDAEKYKIGYLPEERGLYPKKEIMPQLIYFGELAGLSKAQAKQNAQMLLEKLQMSEYAGKRLETLSKGNQQKIQLVATLISNPDIVILDEPFSGLDPVNAMLLKDLIKELISKGKIVLFSSHQMNYIEEFCDEIAVLNCGEIVLSGNIREIKRKFERNTVEIVTTDTAKVSEYLRIVNADIIKNMNIDGDKISVFLEKPENKDRLFSSLSEYGEYIDSFSVKEPSLNEIFVKYTEGNV